MAGKLSAFFGAQDMTVGNPATNLIRFSTPLLIGNLAQQLYSTVDSIVVGNYVGDSALAAIGASGPIINLLLVLFMGVSVGASIMASQYFGAKDKKRLSHSVGTAITATFVVSIFIMVVGPLITHPIMSALQTPQDIYTMSCDYLIIILLGILGSAYYNIISGILRGLGDSVMPLIFLLVACGMNIGLDIWFVAGFKMGVAGAAWATIISQACSCVWVLSFLFGKKTTLRIKKENLMLRPDIILPCLALGLSLFIMQASESIISVCFNSSLLKYGGDVAVGAMTILTSVMQFAMLPLQGLGQGAQPIMSYNYGARNAARVKKAYFLLLKASLCYSVLLWGLVMLFPQIFAGMFTPDAELIAFTKTALRIYMAVMFIFGIQISCQMAFNSLGKAVSSIIVAVMRKFVLLIPLIYIMPHIYTANKAYAVYMAEPVADIIAVTFTAVLFSFQFRKALREIQ